MHLLTFSAIVNWEVSREMLQVLVWVVPIYKRLQRLHVLKGKDLFVVPSYNCHLTSSCKKRREQSRKSISFDCCRFTSQAKAKPRTLKVNNKKDFSLLNAAFVFTSRFELSFLSPMSSSALIAFAVHREEIITNSNYNFLGWQGNSLRMEHSVVFINIVRCLLIVARHSHGIFVVRDSSRQKRSSNKKKLLDATIIYMVEQLNFRIWTSSACLET